MDASGTALPVELTSFVGRDDELVELERLVGERRSVTLTGVGGGGKTRLALRLAARVAARFPDGVRWTDLGALTDPDQVARTVASAVDVPVEPGGDPHGALTSWLRSRQALLCLDTCEHLLDATAELVEAVLRTCPGVRVLATSREPLGVPDEVVWRVRSLTGDEAVRLFADRARTAAPTFRTDDHLHDARAVCERVDGIPLAVELAAAWVRVLDPAQIASGLQDGLALLAGGPRGGLARQQTLTASMAWSHDLLDEADRTVFRRLAVFVGDFSLDAVRAICVDDDTDALAVVGRLVDKSLILVREGAEAVPYRLLDPVRQYAEHRLAAAGEVEWARGRHLDHVLALVERAEPGLDRDQDRWRRELQAHQDDIGAALRWGLRRPDPDDRAGRLAAAMARQWFLRGHAHEGLPLLRQALDRDPTDRVALQGRLWCGTAMLAMISGRIDLTADAAERGLRIATEHGDDRTRARCLVMAGYRPFYFDFERCQELAERGHALGIAVGDPFARDFGLVLAAYALNTRDRHDEAVAVARTARDQSAPRGDRFCAVFARGVELFAAMYGGRLREAVAIGEEMLGSAVPLGDHFAIGTNTANAALAIGMAGDLERAHRLMAPIVRVVDDGPDVDVVGWTVNAGLLALWSGEPADAERWFRRGIGSISADGDDWTSVRCLPGLAGALRHLGRTDEAAAVAARGVALARRFGAPYLLADTLDEQALLLADADPGRAADLHHQALALRVERGLRTFCVDSLAALAAHAVRAGQHVHATRLLAAGAAAREAMGYPHRPVDRPAVDAATAVARTALGPEFPQAWAEGAALSLDVAISAATRGRGRRGRPPTGWAGLTPAELDVVRLVADGLTNPEIGRRLFVSRTTVKTHLGSAFRKLGVASRTELARLAAGHLDGDPR